MKKFLRKEFTLLSRSPDESDEIMDAGVKIATGRGIERGAEGRYEGARALIAGIKRGLLHLRAGAEAT